MESLRHILRSFWFIHFMVFLGLLALFGVLVADRRYLIFFVVLSFSGAVCGSFIRVIDAVRGRLPKT